MTYAQIISKELEIKEWQVENTLQLIDSGCTIPFIARYRKEQTGELDDVILRKLSEMYIYQKSLRERKDQVIRLILESKPDAMTDVLKNSIENALTLTEVEDLYRPFKVKRRTRGTIAREKGLAPLAEYIMAQKVNEAELDTFVKGFISEEKGVNSNEDAINGAMDIIAEDISDDAEIRKYARKLYLDKAILETQAAKPDVDSVYRNYYKFQNTVAVLQKSSHRILAINRGEKDEYLSVSLIGPQDEIILFIKNKYIKSNNNACAAIISRAIEDCWKRLIKDSIEREIRAHLTEIAEEDAIKVFSVNLASLLMIAPVKGKIVLALDPGFRNGCKISIVDATGNVLETGVIYPVPPYSKIQESEKTLLGLFKKYEVDLVALGNGTASAETEVFLVNTLAKAHKKIPFTIVNEAGASVYSASEEGSREFPDFDVNVRSAVSLARRIQDPLAELVKIDPKAIGVGQYQHDMNQKNLDNSLTGVVESCVNSVGVELNTASSALLKFISGINRTIADNIVQYRSENGNFTSRTQLKKVAKLGPKCFEQCAGFLRISESKNILDNTGVHPESYDAALKLLEVTGYNIKDVLARNLKDLIPKIDSIGRSKIAQEIGIGLPTLNDIIKELVKPGRDPRDELPQPILRSETMSIENLVPGSIMDGTVRNVTAFGAFVDIGVHQDGLVHISQISDSFVSNPLDVLSVGDIIKVKILDVDVEKKRISLSRKGL